MKEFCMLYAYWRFLAGFFKHRELKAENLKCQTKYIG